MSRSGYSDDYDYQLTNLWRGAIDRALNGKRGQACLRELLAALEALPEKRLIRGKLALQPPDFIPPNAVPPVCALGALGNARGLDLTKIDADDPWAVGEAFGISRAMAAEIVYMNDDSEYYTDRTPERRYADMVAWVRGMIKEPPPTQPR